GETDPHAGTPLETTNWYLPPVSRPENSLTGVSFRNGGWWSFRKGKMPSVPFVVAEADHWLFEGTGLANGDHFGIDEVGDSIVGYETDAARLAPGDGPLVPTGEDGTPTDFRVLAVARLSSDWDTELEGTSQRLATMGLFTRGGT